MWGGGGGVVIDPLGEGRVRGGEGEMGSEGPIISRQILVLFRRRSCWGKKGGGGEWGGLERSVYSRPINIGTVSKAILLGEGRVGSEVGKGWREGGVRSRERSVFSRTT